MARHKVRLQTPRGYTETRAVDVETLTPEILRRIVSEVATRKGADKKKIRVFADGSEVFLEWGV